MAGKKKIREGVTVQVSQLDALKDTFVLLKFPNKENRTEAEIAYIGEIIESGDELKIINDIQKITYRSNNEINWGIFYSTKETKKSSKSKKNIEENSVNMNVLHMMIDAIKIPIGELNINVWSPYGTIEKRFA